MAKKFATPSVWLRNQSAKTMPLQNGFIALYIILNLANCFGKLEFDVLRQTTKFRRAIQSLRDGFYKG